MEKKNKKVKGTKARMIYKDESIEIKVKREENGKYILQEKDLKTKVISELYHDEFLLEFETKEEAEVFLNGAPHTWVEWMSTNGRHRANKYLRMNE